MWVGAPAGGIWKTEDYGATWICLSDDLPVIGISDIVVHPYAPDTIYIATGERDGWTTFSIGVLKSTDGGLHWDTTGLNYLAEDLEAVNKLLINPENPEVLIAATSKGIYKTNNSGGSWNKVLNASFVKELMFKPGNSNIIYATTFNINGGANIYKSTDGGNSFDLMTNTGIDYSQVCRITLATSPANSNIIYALCCDKYHHGLYGLFRSVDDGLSWESTIYGTDADIVGYTTNGNIEGGQGWYNLSIAISPTDPNEILVGGTHIWKSIDGGFNFEFKDNGWIVNPDWIHGDQHEFRNSPITNTLFAGNDGGIYCSYNGGEDWIDISEGLQILQIYRIGVSATNQDLTITGAQDNGSMMFENNDCVSITGGDGMECIIDFENPNIMYTSLQNGILLRSSNHGHSFYDITPSGAGSGAWSTPFCMHHNNPEILYAGYQEVFKSTNSGSTWEQISENLTGPNPLERLVVAESNENHIYAATYFKIWKTQDGGENWIDITAGLPNHNYPPVPWEALTFYDVVVSPIDPNKVWVTYSNFVEGEKVYKSIDGGNTWENISGNLPNFPVNCIEYQKGSNDGIYIGTDAGVFYTDNDLNEWADMSEGLPNVVVTELEIQYNANKIVAGTYGRGLWESPLFYLLTNTIQTKDKTPFEIYPNPTKGKFRIEVPNESSNISLEIFDQSGKSIFFEFHECFNGRFIKTLDLNGKPKGTYIIQIKINNQSYTKKLVYW